MDGESCQVIRSRRCDSRWVVGRQQRRPIGDAEKQRSDAVELLLREADEVIQAFVLEGPDEVLRISIRHSDLPPFSGPSKLRGSLGFWPSPQGRLGGRP